MAPRTAPTVLAFLLMSCSMLRAQDPAPDALWYLDDGDLIRVLPGGAELDRIDLLALGIVAFDATPAPDGRVWLRTGVQSQLRVVTLSPGTVHVMEVPFGGNVLTPVAFSPAGDAWVVRAPGSLEQYSPAGALLASYSVPGQAVDASFDADGQLWIAHVEPDGRLSRFDPQSGTVQSITVPPPAGQITSIRTAPPAAGSATGSLWVSDTTGRLHVLDHGGQVRNTLRFGGATTRPAFGPGGDAWVAVPDLGQVYHLFADGSGALTGFNYCHSSGYLVHP